jgi:hypothetical protein
MATQEFNSLPTSNLSTGSSNCCAHALDSEQRQQLAIQALLRTESITTLAERHGVSRKFVYHQADKGSQALNEVFQAPPLADDEVLFYLPITRAWLRQVVLGLVLLCHSSFRGVIAFFRDLLDQPIALGTVHNIVQQAVVEARPINARQDLSGVRAGSHDELFQGGKPVLAGIDLDSLYCYLLATEAHRDAETWAVHLLDLTEQGLNPDYVVADGGTGLRAGQALAWPKVACDGDVFHGLQTMTRLATTLEKRAYAAINESEQLKQKMDKAKRRNRGRSLSKKLARARAKEVTAIHLADTVQILSTWLREDILALAGPDAPSRRMLYDFVVDTLHELEVLDGHRLRPVRCALANQRDTLLAFATRLDQELEALAKQFGVSVDHVREMLALTQLSSASTAYWIRTTALHQQLHARFFPLQQALEDRCSRFHRASSLVESFNSRLRSYFFLRRQIGPAYLDLLRFFLNHQPFARSERPERRGKSPAELLTGQSHPHWLEILGFTLFRQTHATA